VGVGVDVGVLVAGAAAVGEVGPQAARPRKIKQGSEEQHTRARYVAQELGERGGVMLCPTFLPEGFQEGGHGATV
jgi:hypothetical protein